MLPLVLAMALQVTASRSVLVADLDRLNAAYWQVQSAGECRAIRARIDADRDRLVFENEDWRQQDRNTFKLLTAPAWQRPAGTFRIPAALLRLVPFWRRK